MNTWWEKESRSTDEKGERLSMDQDRSLAKGFKAVLETKEVKERPRPNPFLVKRAQAA